MDLQPNLRLTLMGAAYVSAYVGLEAVSQVGIYRAFGISPWAPAAGLAIAFAFIGGRYSWPFMIAASLLTLSFVHPQPLHPAALVLIGLAGSAVWLGAGEVLRRMSGFSAGLRTLRSVLLLFAVAILASLLQSVVYIGTLWAWGQVTEAILLAVTWRYFVGQLVGILVATPLLLLGLDNQRWPTPDETHLLQLFVLIGALGVIFDLPSSTNYQLFYLLFLPVLWVALRDGIHGAVLILNACQIGIIISADYRVSFVPGLSALQTMMIVLVVTGLLIGATVTEGRAVAQRLRDQQTALNRALRLRSAGETAAAIAHQINQPLTAISTYAAIALDALESGGTAAAKSSVGKLVAECDRAAAVLRSIRDLVKLGGLTRVDVRLPVVLGELADMHASECVASRITLEMAVPPTFPSVICDRVQLQQALFNIIGNSIEAIRETGRSGIIRVTAKSAADAVAIDVSDNGPGFAPGLETLVGAPFTTTKANGSGLGLAIARSVAEAHGGSLSIVPMQGGATVRLVLPINRVV